MPDEFTPEATSDFEAFVERAAAEHSNGNNAPPPQPPPAQDQLADPPRPPVGAPRTSAPHAGDPFAQLEAVARDLPLMYRELGDLNVALARMQITVILGLGAAVLLAVFLYKAGHAPAAP